MERPAGPRRTSAPWILFGALAVAPQCSGRTEPDPLDLPPGMELVLRSPRFEIHTDHPAAAAAHHQRVLEGLCAWFDEHWFPVPWKEPLRVLLFADSQRMTAWSEARGLDKAWGRYIPEWNLIAIDLSTGLGTALHELVHCFQHRACAHPRTTFVEEGVASFFEKFLGHIDDAGRVELTVGYFSWWRFAEAKQKHRGVDLATQWRATGEDFDDALAYSFMLFLHRNGWFSPFVRALLTTTGDGQKELEAISGRTIAQLDTEWHTWIDAQEVVVGGDMFLVEKSFVAEAAAWQQWLTDNAARLRFDEQAQRFCVR